MLIMFLDYVYLYYYTYHVIKHVKLLCIKLLLIVYVFPYVITSIVFGTFICSSKVFFFALLMRRR